MACNMESGDKEQSKISENPLKGNWNFLDKYGNYNEAYFGDSIYRTFNRHYVQDATFKYFYKNDSLWSDCDLRVKGLTPIAKIEILEKDRFVLSNQYVSDTLHKMSKEKYTLKDLHPFKDSAVFYPAFYKRYEDFLISKGIITEEEAKDFNENQKVPEDIRK